MNPEWMKKVFAALVREYGEETAKKFDMNKVMNAVSGNSIMLSSDIIPAFERGSQIRETIKNIQSRMLKDPEDTVGLTEEGAFNLINMIGKDPDPYIIQKRLYSSMRKNDAGWRDITERKPPHHNIQDDLFELAKANKYDRKEIKELTDDGELVNAKELPINKKPKKEYLTIRDMRPKPQYGEGVEKFDEYPTLKIHEEFVEHKGQNTKRNNAINNPSKEDLEEREIEEAIDDGFDPEKINPEMIKAPYYEKKVEGIDDYVPTNRVRETINNYRPNRENVEKGLAAYNNSKENNYLAALIDQKAPKVGKEPEIVASLKNTIRKETDERLKKQYIRTLDSVLRSDNSYSGTMDHLKELIDNANSTASREDYKRTLNEFRKAKK